MKMILSYLLVEKRNPLMFISNIKTGFTLILLVFFSACNVAPQKVIYSEAELGKELFFDPILSRDSSLSCAGCHKPQFAFADNQATSKGVANRNGTRNTPGVMNQLDRNYYFWDGRAETLEQQALMPIENRDEMDLPLSLAIKRLKNNAKYRQAFYSIYGAAPSSNNLAKAISAYENTLETSNTIFDDYMSGNDTSQFSESAKRGLNLFNNKGKCFDCHFGSDFTGNDRFKNIGLYNGKNLNDVGRYAITGNSADLGAFKVPGLRNVAQTAPYMHNGLFKTLEEVIDFYNEPDKHIPNSINRDTLLKQPLGLTATEKKDLLNFLLTLSDKQFEN